jgi:hypothetical protein
MTCEVCVGEASRDRPCWVDAGGTAEEHNAIDVVWDIKRGQGAVGGPQEWPNCEVYVAVNPRDFSRRVDADGKGSDKDGRWNIERNESPIGRLDRSVGCAGSRRRLTGRRG